MWKRINEYGLPMSSRYKEREGIIELWNQKYTKEKQDKERWEKEEKTEPAKVKKEREKYFNEEEKKKKYWDNIKKNDRSGESLNEEIRYIGNIPGLLSQFQDSWIRTSLEEGERAALSTGLEDVPTLSAAQELEQKIKDDSFKTFGTYFTYDNKRIYQNWGNNEEVTLPYASSDATIISSVPKPYFLFP